MQNGLEIGEKMNNFKVILITSNSLRHRYAAKILNDCLNLVGIVSEKKSLNTGLQTSDKADKIIQRHFSQRDDIETKYFGKISSFPDDINLLSVNQGEANSDDVFKWVQSKHPDIVILYGCSIIKNPLLNYYDKSIINLHLGLSPYYRGSGTNFWPLVDDLPECVGGTIHLATQNVDAGGILSQVRPENISKNDTAHDLGSKTIISSFKKMCEILPLYFSGKIKPYSQDLSKGKLCRRKDFDSEAVLKLWQNFENGMLIKYINNKSERDNSYPIFNEY